MDAFKGSASGLETQLRSGIAAAQAGDRDRARQLLTQVVEQDEALPEAWLWLSKVVDAPEDREVCLENLLTLEPDNEFARRELKEMHRDRAARLLEQGTLAVKAGQKTEAVARFRRLVELDPQNPVAWQWLSDLADSPEERESCLRKILEFDPYNEMAHRGLVQLEAQKLLRPPELPVPPQPPPAGPSEWTAGAAASAPALWPKEQQDERAVVPHDSVRWSATHDFDDERLCPYCAGALTRLNDSRCPVCREPLWIEYRPREQRSSFLWLSIIFLGVIALFSLILPTLSLILRGSKLGLPDPLDLLPLYLGLPHAVPPEIAAQILNDLPRLYVVLPFLAAALALPLAAALYLRWPPAYYLTLILVGSCGIAGIAAGVSTLLHLPNSLYLPPAVIAIVGPIAIFWNVLETANDFVKDKRRLLLRPDRGVNLPSAILARGEFYAQNKVWGLAIIHLRKAAGMMPERIGPPLLLAAAYLKLKRRDLAAQALQRARQINSQDLRIQQLDLLLQGPEGLQN